MANNARRRPRRQILYDDPDSDDQPADPPRRPVLPPWMLNNEFGIRYHEENALDRENQAEPEWRDNNRDPFSRTGIGYHNR